MALESGHIATRNLDEGHGPVPGPAPSEMRVTKLPALVPASFSSVLARVFDSARSANQTIGDTVQRIGAPLGPVRRWFAASWPIRFVTSSLRRRIVLANTVGLAILIFGSLYISQNQDGLIEAKRESLEAQGRLIAAAIVSNAKIDDRDGGGEIDKGQASGRPAPPFRDDGFAALELTIGPERVAPVLGRMIQGTHNRARIYARDGSLILDSEKLRLTGLSRAGASATDPADEEADIKDFWTHLSRFLTRTKLDVYKEPGSAGAKGYPPIQAALAGKTSPMLLLNSDNEQIVAVAVPLIRLGGTHGAMLLSTRPGELDKIRNKERRRIVPLALMAMLAAMIGSLLLAKTVATPMKQLSAAADSVGYNINARNELPNFGDRQDEIGQLSRAFNKMTAALYRRAEASEKFAADVAHELKNPLTAARSTAESLHYAKTDAKREELVGQINAELKRLNKLITDVSNASRMEAELALHQTTPVRIEEVLRGVVSTFQDLISNSERRIDLVVHPSAEGAAGVIAGHPGRIGQVFTNLIDNALSFSPDDGTVSIVLLRDRDELAITFDDKGPGIPDDMVEKIFERFYTYRPTAESSRGNNSGLGLAISREIVRAHDGRIWAENRAEGGARLVVRFPVVPRRPARRGSVRT